MPVTVQELGPAPVDPRADQVMAPMRDGVRLATDVYLPDRPGRHPAVLVRLPYDKCGRYTFMPLLAPHVTERGYAFVVQDVRGKFRSEGETVPFVHEVEDGYDTIDWIVGQPWSNGVVGMFGDSYFGFTQWAAVAAGHPALKAIVPRVTSADLAFMDTWSGEGVTALYAADYLGHYWVDNPIYDFAVDWSHRPLAEAFDEAFEAIGARSAGMDAMIASLTGGGPGLKPFPTVHPFDGAKVPVLHSVGWFDNLMPDSMRDYTALRARPDRRDLQYLIADSIDHENYVLGDVPIGEEDEHNTSDAAIERMMPAYIGPALEFFDVCLHGRDAARHPGRALAPGQRRLADGRVVAAAGGAGAAAAPGRRRPRGGRRRPARSRPRARALRRPLDPRPVRPGALDRRGPVLLLVRVSGRARGRGPRRRGRVHQRTVGWAARPRGAGDGPPARRVERPVDPRLRQARRRGARRGRAHARARPDRDRRPRPRARHAGRARSPGLPAAARTPPAPADRGERLPAVRAAPRHGGQPVAGDALGAHRAVAGLRRQRAGVREPDASSRAGSEGGAGAPRPPPKPTPRPQRPRRYAAWAITRPSSARDSPSVSSARTSRSIDTVASAASILATRD